MEDTILTKFAGMIGTDACPTEQEVAFLEAAYPYFLLPAAMRLANAKDMSEEERRHLERRGGLASNTTDALFRIVDPDGRLLSEFYPERDTPSKPSTDSAIDTFLETYGKSTPEEDALLTRLIFNPVPEYAATLVTEDTPTAQSEDPQGQDAVLDAFLSKFPQEHKDTADDTPKAPQPRKQKAAKVSEDSLLSESLAKIYISRGRYDKAYEIIHSLSLNFPKKSIYFADQLRFLQKLILNSKYKDKTN